MATKTIELTLEEKRELWRALYEDALIKTYVSEADQMTRQEALELAIRCDLQSALELASDASAVQTV